MLDPAALARFKGKAKLTGRYEKQLRRLNAAKIGTECIETAVEGAIANLASAEQAALVVYGEPQSGKTEMMICLTARLLDSGHRVIVHLMNDSVDLLSQNLKRFISSGLSPSARTISDLGEISNLGQEVVVFCKKNARDLDKLIDRLKNIPKVVIIDDEADFATPNAKVNKGLKTKINMLVETLLGVKGYYIGVTATPARLNLNNTLDNDAEKWVRFPAHNAYTGQETFFPEGVAVPYRLQLLTQGGRPEDARDALLRFLVTVAYLNTSRAKEENYTFLVHTSGKKADHQADRAVIEVLFNGLIDPQSKEFEDLISRVYDFSKVLYPNENPDQLTEYVVANASRATLVVLNSERDRTATGAAATEPTSPFTIIIGGNIVSRGVTFQNLLSMFFTRTVSGKLQQDTYVQRARMFGSRGGYLPHFELTIPQVLFRDWKKCFLFHRLSLATIEGGFGSPVWMGDSRVSVASAASIKKATVTLNKGEMSFQIFDYSSDLDAIVRGDQMSISTLEALSAAVGQAALPKYLINYIRSVQTSGAKSLAIHTASSIAHYGPSADKEAIARKKGFMGLPQLEPNKFPDAVHHVKIFHNGKGKARVFYKAEDIQFIQSQKS